MKKLSRRGGALVEVVIATLLLAITVSGVFAALLTASTQTGSLTEREQASQHVDLLLDELRNYVTSDTAPSPDAPGEPAGPARTWRLPGDACGCWALQEGAHDVSSRLPAALRARGATLAYDVSVVDVNGSPLRRVSAKLTWEPVP
jgi:Tfp pilus assembly protein PilV